MPMFSRPGWTRVPMEDETFSESSRSKKLLRRDKWLVWFPWVLALSSTLAFVTLLGFVLVSSSDSSLGERHCVEFTSSWSPGLEAVRAEDYTLRTFNGSIGFRSPYKGPPSADVDAAWAQIDQMDAIALSEREIQKLGKDPEVAVKLPEDLGGGYMGTIEVVHQLHCLHLLWQGTHMEHYSKLSAALGTSHEGAMRNHLDHCADILRQNLQCTSDVGFISYVWLPDRETPYPDFNTQHKCRNFDSVMEWARSHEVPLYANGPFTRTSGAPTVPTPP